MNVLDVQEQNRLNTPEQCAAADAVINEWLQGRCRGDLQAELDRVGYTRPNAKWFRRLHNAKSVLKSHGATAIRFFHVPEKNCPVIDGFHFAIGEKPFRASYLRSWYGKQERWSVIPEDGDKAGYESGRTIETALNHKEANA
jgi:hypothetical protein